MGWDASFSHFDVLGLLFLINLETNRIPIFKFVAAVNREFIWELMFRLCNKFFVTFDKFHYVFTSVENPFGVCIGSYF